MIRSFLVLVSLAFSAFAFVSVAQVQVASALELDWSGQFRAEYHFLHNYSFDSTDAALGFDTARYGAGGYYLPSGGKKDATFETLFLRLRPKVIVNDNIYIKSEFWLGDPVYGIFGNAVPGTGDQRQFYSNQSRGSTITAQRFWAEFLSDIGTVQVGRAPLHWGLGVVWNSGDGLWDRYQSTGDTVRLISKFGAFSVIPSFIVYSTGNAVGGSGRFDTSSATSGLLTNGLGSGGEYTLALKYENLDDDLEGGVNFIRRLAGAGQDPNGGYLSPFSSGVAALNYNIWDIYAKKRFGKLTLAAEAPITSGQLGTPSGQGMDYATFALAAEADWKITDTWELQLKGGHAPGQQNSGSATPDKFTAFFFNPAYHLGNIMFNYQTGNFFGPNTANNPAASGSQRSPFDNPIVNANYLMGSAIIHTEKWTFNGGLVYAHADKTAANGQYFYNTLRRQLIAPNAGNGDQSGSLGVETDLGVAFQWDEFFTFRTDLGVLFPGAFWKYTNLANTENATSAVYNAAFRVGVNF